MAREEKDEEAVQAEPEVKGKRGTMKWVIIGVVILVLLGAAAGGGWYVFNNMMGDKKAAHKAPPIIGSLWSLDPFIVNLMDNSGERYLKVVMQFEVSESSIIQELELVKPRVRDSILDLLSSKSLADLADTPGKQRLREEIILRVNNSISRGRISKVYFTEFVIQ
ncbi:MAG: flagellar basal body-associated FliL family protein [Syntrophaceae bacterium]|nr:flagellar basal body-associated FliL family protein [Syntrophaceae bacterium]